MEMPISDKIQQYLHQKDGYLHKVEYPQHRSGNYNIYTYYLKKYKTEKDYIEVIGCDKNKSKAFDIALNRMKKTEQIAEKENISLHSAYCKVLSTVKIKGYRL